MENDSWRKEYAMNEDGAIWVGNRWRNVGRPWMFGQVNIILIVLELIQIF